MSTTAWQPKILIFFSKKFEFWFLTKSWNHLSFVNISPTLVIDTSMERSSRVLQHGNPKIWFFFSKKFEIEFDLYCDLCWRAEINIQIGRNMHLYVVIGDASSSLWGSASSYFLDFLTIKYIAIWRFIILTRHLVPPADNQQALYPQGCGYREAPPPSLPPPPPYLCQTTTVDQFYLH